MPEPTVTAQDVLNASKGMLQKQLYVIFTTPARHAATRSRAGR